MKVAIHFVLLGALALPAGAAEPAPNPASRVAMRDAVTHDQIVETARAARKDNPAPVFTPAEGADPSVANRPKDLLSRSQILSYLGSASLVPKRAVLHLPQELADRATMSDGARFLVWREFYSANRAWIRTVEVSRAQAEGRQPLDEEVVKSFAKERRVVIATYQEGPISVASLRTPPTETAGKQPVSTVAKP